jgi:hypothetical protein
MMEIKQGAKTRPHFLMWKISIYTTFWQIALFDVVQKQTTSRVPKATSTRDEYRASRAWSVDELQRKCSVILLLAVVDETLYR